MITNDFMNKTITLITIEGEKPKHAIMNGHHVTYTHQIDGEDWESVFPGKKKTKVDSGTRANFKKLVDGPIAKLASVDPDAEKGNSSTDYIRRMRQQRHGMGRHYR
jgi:hypothetical protein